MPNPHLEYAERHVACLRLVERLASLFRPGLPLPAVDPRPDEFVAAIIDLRIAGGQCKKTDGVRTIDFIGQSPNLPTGMCHLRGTSWLELSQKIIAHTSLNAQVLLENNVTPEAARERWNTLEDFFRLFFSDFSEPLLSTRLRDEAVRADRLTEPDNEADSMKGDHFTVTLQQVAHLVNRQKRTLERWMQNDPKFPLPDVEPGSGSGRPNEWRWSRIRPYLERKTGKKLPDRHPADTSRPDYGALKD